MRPLIVIPARGGSKGLPGKNIKHLNGKPLIHYTIEAAREVFCDDCIFISTDSEEIIEVASLTGIKVPFVRPKELSTDEAKSSDVIEHALQYYFDNNNVMPDFVMLLQPTSPFRTSAHIREALKCFSDDIDLVVSVKETDSNPYYVLFEENDKGYLNKSKDADFHRRQDCPTVYEFNGAIYIFNTKSLEKGRLKGDRIIKYLMSKHDSVDIDDEIDWLVATALMEK